MGGVVSYGAFLASKEHRVEVAGREPLPVQPSLYPFQADIVRWAVKLGRAAIFADTGMGKSRMQLEWARNFAGRVLMVAPIAVAEQTIREGERMGVHVRRLYEPGPWVPGIVITNYERLHKFVGERYDAIVLDESSILKSLDGATRTLLLDEFTSIPHRLCCTATPAPNDISELGNHAQFLGVMSRVEMLATFFVHDSDKAGGAGWRLKGHAAEAMYQWLTTWSCYVRRPSDLGYEDGDFELPPLQVADEMVRSDWRPDGMLFAVGLGGIGGRSSVRRQTAEARIARAIELVKASPEQTLIWCGLNDEQDGIAQALGDDCVSIDGRTEETEKIELETAWRTGRVKHLVTKPKIFGWGLNWQHCRRMVFLGLGDSYEQYYQAIRRCWRYGQRFPVDVRIVVSDAEGEIAANVRAKEQEAQRTAAEVVRAMRDRQIAELRGDRSSRLDYAPTVNMEVPAWVSRK